MSGALLLSFVLSQVVAAPEVAATSADIAPRACVPGQQIECGCGGGKTATQTCVDDGSRFGACSCAPTPAAAPGPTPAPRREPTTSPQPSANGPTSPAPAPADETEVVSFPSVVIGVVLILAGIGLGIGGGLELVRGEDYPCEGAARGACGPAKAVRKRGIGLLIGGGAGLLLGGIVAAVGGQPVEKPATPATADGGATIGWSWRF